jgi:hypothetical protein
MKSLRSLSREAACVLLLCAAFVLPAGPASAQTPTTNRVGFTAGFTHLAHQDVIHSPFIHRSVSPVSVEAFYRRTGSLRQFAGLRYSAVDSRLTAPYPIEHHDHFHGSLPHVYLLVDATYGAGRSIRPADEGHEAVGLALQLDLQATDYNYGLEYNFGYFLSTGLNAWYERELTPSPRHRVTGRAMAPIVSWVARSPYLVNDDRFIENIANDGRLATALALAADGELASWDRLQRLNLSLGYGYAVSPRVEVGASYRFTYLRARDPRPLTSMQNDLGFSTSYRF